MMTDNQDKNFSEEVTEATGISKEEIEAKISKMDIDSMFDVLDALSHGEKERVASLMGGGAKDDAITEEREADTHSIGDKIKYRGKEGIVKIPDGPNDSVGILIDGVLKMVDKKKIAGALKEGFLGVGSIPHSVVPGSDNANCGALDPAILRMMQLAGLTSYAETSEGDADDTPEALERFSRVLGALDDLAEHIPQLRIKDVGQVRDKLNDLNNIISGIQTS